MFGPFTGGATACSISEPAANRPPSAPVDSCSERMGCELAATNPARRDAFYRLADWQPGLNEIVFALASNHGQAWGIFAAVL